MLTGTTRGGSETERLVPSEGSRETMKKKHLDYEVVPYPKLRRTPMIHGLLEVDVTRPLL
jgi:hypothetical protein